MTRICLLVGGCSIEHDSSLHMFFYLRELLAQKPRAGITVAELYYVSPSRILYRHEIQSLEQIPRDEADLKAGERMDLSLLPYALRTSGLFVFSLLQGTEGEDGHYQGWASAFGIPSNLGAVFPAAVSMNKWTQALIANTLLAGRIRPIDTLILSASPCERSVLRAVAHFTGRPCVLKPNSLGVSAFCQALDRLTAEDVREFGRRLAPYDNRFLVQERIVGREVSCGCLRIDGQIATLPVLELHVPSGFLSQSAKFSKNGYSYSFLPAADPLAARAAECSVDLFGFMDFETTCRCDFMVSQEGDIHFLEANSKPGLTRESHYTLMLERSGYTLLDLIEIAIRNEALRFKPVTELRYDVELVFDH